MSTSCTSMPTRTPAEAAARAREGLSLRLSLPVRAGEVRSAVDLELAHCERLIRMAAYRAMRDGTIVSTGGLSARLVPGQVHDRHGAVYCLDSCVVELVEGRGLVVARVEFPRAAFAAFAVARVTYLIQEAGTKLSDAAVTYSLHAVDSTEEPFPVVVPHLPPLSVDRLAAEATAQAAPECKWLVSFMTPDVCSGLETMAHVSAAAGVEVAGRIHARVGFDSERRCFVRILDRLVISRHTRASALSVVSTTQSWADFLASGDTAAPQAPSSVHTHLHLDEQSPGTDGAPGDHLLDPASAGSLGAASEPCISINDIVTHYTAFPDPLSAALILSVFPDRRVIKLYGYTPDAQLRVEPGYWALHRGATATPPQQAVTGFGVPSGAGQRDGSTGA